MGKIGRNVVLFDSFPLIILIAVCVNQTNVLYVKKCFVANWGIFLACNDLVYPESQNLTNLPCDSVYAFMYFAHEGGLYNVSFIHICIYSYGSLTVCCSKPLYSYGCSLLVEVCTLLFFISKHTLTNQFFVLSI